MKVKIIWILLVIVLILSMTLVIACGGNDQKVATPEEPAQTETEEAPEAEVQTPETEGDIRPEFKELVDNYEVFMDEYFAFMKTYDENDKSQEPEFLQIISDYTDMTRRFNEWEKQGLTEDEKKYMDAAFERVGEKQLEAGIAQG